MRRIFLSASAAVVLSMALQAQAPRMPEPLSAWPYYKEIQIPRNAGALVDFVLDREMLDQWRLDHADVRLYDSAGREIPYVLRVRHEVETRDAYTAREFNRSAEDGTSLVSCDLGTEPQEHNEVEIQTAGNNFRRLADVQGSSDGVRWSTLVSGAILFRFSAGGRTVEQQSVPYPASRYRYLRIRLSRDPQVDRTAPPLNSVQVRRSVHLKGEMTAFAAALQPREADRLDGRPASVWRIDLGSGMPLERVSFTTGEGPYSRPFRLEEVADPASPSLLASGELIRREDRPAAQPVIRFPEHYARRLKLTVTDDRNTPLTIVGFTVEGAARQVVFEAPTGSDPIRVYYGNSKATAPRYDLAARLPEDLQPPPLRLTLQAQHYNPIYSPEPRPLSERSPWLVYVVLGAAGVVLAAILLSLVRQSRRSVAEV